MNFSVGHRTQHVCESDEKQHIPHIYIHTSFLLLHDNEAKSMAAVCMNLLPAAWLAR